MTGLTIERFTKQLIMVIAATVVFAAMADDVCVPDISTIGEYTFGNAPLPNVPLKERDNIVGPEGMIEQELTVDNVFLRFNRVKLTYYRDLNRLVEVTYMHDVVTNATIETIDRELDESKAFMESKYKFSMYRGRNGGWCWAGKDDANPYSVSIYAMEGVVYLSVKSNIEAAAVPEQLRTKWREEARIEREKRHQKFQAVRQRIGRRVLCGEEVERSDVERAQKELWNDVAFEEVYVQISNRWACSVLTNQSCGTGLGECMIPKKDMMQYGGRTYSQWRLQARRLVWFNPKGFEIGDLTGPYPYGTNKTEVIFGRNWSNEYGVAVKERHVYSTATKLSGLVYQIHMRETLATNRVDRISFGRWMDAIASKVSMACGEQFCHPSFGVDGLSAKCTGQTYELEIEGKLWDWMDSKCVRMCITLSLRSLLKIAQDENETLNGFASSVKASHPTDADILKKCREYEEMRSKENAELERIEAMKKPYEALSLDKSGLEKLENIKFAGFEFGGDGLISLKGHETQDKIRIEGNAQRSQNRLGSKASQTPREKCFDCFLSMGSNDCFIGWTAYGNFRHTCVTKRLYKVHLFKEYSGNRCRQVCEQDLDKIVSSLEQANGSKMIGVDHHRSSKHLTYLSDVHLGAKQKVDPYGGFSRWFSAKTKNRLNVEISAARVASCNGVPCDKVDLSVTITSPDLEALAVLESEDRRQWAERGDSVNLKTMTSVNLKTMTMDQLLHRFLGPYESMKRRYAEVLKEAESNHAVRVYDCRVYQGMNPPPPFDDFIPEGSTCYIAKDKYSDDLRESIMRSWGVFGVKKTKTYIGDSSWDGYLVDVEGDPCDVVISGYRYDDVAACVGVYKIRRYGISDTEGRNVMEAGAEIVSRVKQDNPLIAEEELYDKLMFLAVKAVDEENVPRGLCADENYMKIIRGLSIGVFEWGLLRLEDAPKYSHGDRDGLSLCGFEIGKKYKGSVSPVDQFGNGWLKVETMLRPAYHSLSNVTLNISAYTTNVVGVTITGDVQTTVKDRALAIYMEVFRALKADFGIVLPRPRSSEKKRRGIGGKRGVVTLRSVDHRIGKYHVKLELDECRNGKKSVRDQEETTKAGVFSVNLSIKDEELEHELLNISRADKMPPKSNMLRLQKPRVGIRPNGRLTRRR